MELWIILSFIGALALIGFRLWDAKRRFDNRVRSLLRLQKTLRECDALTDQPKQATGLILEPSREPSGSPPAGLP